MAADGSLKFDTKINTEGFEEGITTLTKSVEKLTAVMERIADKVAGAFSGARESAARVSGDIDGITASAKTASDELERLQREKASTFTGTIHFNDAPETTESAGRYDIYGNDVDEMIAKNRALETAVKQTSSTIQLESEKDERSLIGLKDSMIYALEVFKEIPAKIISFAQSSGDYFERSKGKARTLQDEIDRYTDALYRAERAGLGLGDKQYNTAFSGLARAKQKAEEYKKSLLRVHNGQRKTGKSAKTLGDSLKKTGSEAKKAGQKMTMLSMLGRSVLFSVVFRGLSMVSKAFTEGLSSLAQYSDATNKSMSMLMSANTRLKNSFATVFSPALEAAAPALKRVIDLLSIGATYAGQFIAALTGKATFVKAVDVQEDYADSLKKTNAEEKKNTKETEKTVAAFDDLIVMQQKAQEIESEEEYKPPTPDQMFETVEIESDIKKFADLTKSVLSDLFAPIKASWAEHGGLTIEAAKAAFNSLKILAGDVGDSFMQVWNTEGYGKQITDDLLITFTNLMLTVSALADRFDEAWVKADNGTNILRHIGDILLIISGFFRDASEEIRDWASKLDFEPLLKSFDNLLVKMNPVVKIIGSALLWLLSDVLLPLAKWAIECAIPAVLDLVAAGFEVLASVLNALQPLAMWLWDAFLQPLGKWAGEVFIAAVQKIVEWLTKFSDWISENEEAVQNITIVIASFFAAWKFYGFVEGVKKMIDIVSGGSGLIGALEKLIPKLDTTRLKYAGIAAAIVSVIKAVNDIYKNWNKMSPSEKIIAGVLAAAAAVATLAVALGAITGPAGAIAIGAAIAAALLASQIAISAGRSVSTISGGHGGGSRPFSAYSSSAAADVPYRMPRLATGTVVPPRAGEFAAILGDNNRDTEIVSPVPAMKQAFKEAIEEMGGIGGSQTLRAELIVDGTKFGQLVYKFNNKERQRIGVRMVTEG